MLDKLKSMAIFTEVAHLGSFRAAAKSQGVSPSVISQQISRLEKKLGQTLLNRSTRKLVLTPVGEVFLVHCDAMLKAANSGMTSVMQNTSQGSLRIALPCALAVPLFGKFICAYRKKNPFINLSLNFNDEYVDIVDEGIDIALRTGLLEDSSLKARKVMPAPRFIVASPEYLNRMGSVQSPEELNQYCWIGRVNPMIRPHLYNKEGVTYTVPKQSKFIQVNNIQAIRALVLSNNGVAMMSEILIGQDIAKGKLIRLLPSWEFGNADLYAIWSAQKTTGQLIRNFIDSMVQYFSHNDSTQISNQ